MLRFINRDGYVSQTHVSGPVSAAAASFQGPSLESVDRIHSRLPSPSPFPPKDHTDGGGEDSQGDPAVAWELLRDTLKNGVHQLRPLAVVGPPESVLPLGWVLDFPCLLSRRSRFLPEDSQPHGSVWFPVGATACTRSHSFQAAKFRPASPPPVPKARLKSSSRKLGLEGNQIIIQHRKGEIRLGMK